LLEHWRSPMENSNVYQFSEGLLKWFRENARKFPWRTEKDPYKILISEKLLQQTDTGHVMKVYSEFFKKYPSFEALAASEEDDIAKAIRPLGFWRQRARQFKIMAQEILTKYKGKIPEEKSELLSILGIGKYVANAVLCFAFNKDEAIVDVNIRRLAHRLFYWAKALPKDEDIERLMRSLITKGDAKEFNWALIDFATIICKRKPKCSICFVKDLCVYYATEVTLKKQMQVPKGSA